MPNDIWSSTGQAIQPRILQEAMEIIAAMEDAQTEAEILQQVLGYVRHFGATNVLAGTIPAQGQGRRQQLDHILFSAWPDDWVSHYFRSGYVFHDPTIRLVKEKRSPFLWKDLRPRDLRGDAARIMGEAGEFGLRNGCTIALQTLEGAVVGLSIGGERIEIGVHNYDRLKLLATIAIDRALQLREMDLLPLSQGVTLRERRALQLAANGLKESEISTRMGISYNSTGKHLRSVRTKLGARNTTNAIAIAMRLGLLR